MFGIARLVAAGQGSMTVKTSPTTLSAARRANVALLAEFDHFMVVKRVTSGRMQKEKTRASDYG
jgi:hypothetical protein